MLFSKTRKPSSESSLQSNIFQTIIPCEKASSTQRPCMLDSRRENPPITANGVALPHIQGTEREDNMAKRILSHRRLYSCRSAQSSRDVAADGHLPSSSPAPQTRATNISEHTTRRRGNIPPRPHMIQEPHHHIK